MTEFIANLPINLNMDYLSFVIVAFIVYVVYKIKRRPKKLSKREIDRIIKREMMKNGNSCLLHQYEHQKKNFARKGFETSGVYIFTNLRNKKSYVGQSVNILKRVDTHIKGRGSEDLYLDILRGHEFLLQFVRLRDSKFHDLNSLERYYIKKKNAFTKGYNKTRGNK